MSFIYILTVIYMISSLPIQAISCVWGRDYRLDDQWQMDLSFLLSKVAELEF